MKCLILYYIFIVIGTISAKMDMTFQMMEIIEVDNEMAKIEGYIGEENRINLNISILQDIPSIDLKLELFAKQDKKYIPTSIKIETDMCDVFKYEYLLFDADFKKYGYLPDSCPVKKGNYYLKNFKMDVDKIEMLFETFVMISWQNIKLRTIFLQNHKKISVTDMYIKISNAPSMMLLGQYNFY